MATMYSGARRLLSPGGGLYDVLREASRSYQSWDEFLKLDLPGELSPEDAWGIVRLVHRTGGIDVPVPDIDNNEYWYFRTHEIADITSEIACACRTGSPLHRSLSTAPHRRVLVRSRIEETVASAQLDGLAISERQASEMLRLERVPRNSTERLVANTLKAIDELEALVGEPFTPALMKHLEDLLLTGVDVSEVPSIPPRMGLMTSDYTDEVVQANADRMLSRILAYANDKVGDPHDNVVSKAILLPDLFRFYRPVGTVSSQIGRLVFRLYTLKHDLPVLGILPISRTKLLWEQGKHSAAIRIEPDAYHEMRMHTPTEMTAYTTLSAQMARAALTDLSNELRRVEKRDSELRDLLQNDPEINHRQRSILGRALRSPDAQFRIAYHKTTHNVVYATARADMLQLVEKGYLEVHKQNRAMVFTPAPNLKAKLTGKKR